MIPETSRCVPAALASLSQPALWKDLGRWSRAHGPAHCCHQPRRHLSVSRRVTAKGRTPRPPREKVHIPGLEMVTYAEKMHYVPGLTKPVFPTWERSYKDPRFYKSPPRHEMSLHQEKPCYVFNQRSSILEGVRQALWLTKTKMITSLPPQLLLAVEDPANQIPDQDERVQNAIKHARFWDTTEERPRKDKYSTALLTNLLHLCATLRSSHPATCRRRVAEEYWLAASWSRGDDLFQVRGRNGLLHNCMDPLPVVSGEEEVAETAEHVLENIYPVSPTIDLHKTQVYQENINHTGFRDDFPHPHAHTVYFLDGADTGYKLLPEQFRAKMLMFTFGNALARAHALYGTQPRSVLERPVTVQAVGTNGRLFQFLVFQLNTTDLAGDQGVKNQVWLEADVPLYDFAKVRPRIKKKQVAVPAGLAGYKPETFSKFLALYLHGAV